MMELVKFSWEPPVHRKGNSWAKVRWASFAHPMHHPLLFLLSLQSFPGQFLGQFLEVQSLVSWVWTDGDDDGPESQSIMKRLLLARMSGGFMKPQIWCVSQEKGSFQGLAMFSFLFRLEELHPQSPLWSLIPGLRCKVIDVIPSCTLPLWWSWI